MLAASPSPNDGNITLTIDADTFASLQDVLDYTLDNYDDLDDTILNVSKEEIAEIQGVFLQAQDSPQDNITLEITQKQARKLWLINHYAKNFLDVEISPDQHIAATEYLILEMPGQV